MSWKIQKLTWNSEAGTLQSCFFGILFEYTGSDKYLFFGKCFKKKTTEYLLKFVFLFESTILPVNNRK